VRPPVWRFGTDSAGLRFRFVTNADSLRARWRLRRPERLAMPHMSAAGVSGLDLYVRDGDTWHWLGVGAPDRKDVNERVLVRGLEKDRREYLLYLPLYNGVDSVEIGLPADASFAPAPDRYSQRKPVVFYGSSRLQGACASRPGMAYPSLIGRRLDWPVINLGFSGNAKTEPEMAMLLAELDPAVYVLDSLPNLTVTETGERMEPFIRILRSRHPATPIVLVELVDYADAKFVAGRRDKANGSNAILRGLYQRLIAAGDSQLYYVSAAQVLALGDDCEHTVDGAHPNDLGFFRMAEAVTPVVQSALRGAHLSRASMLTFDTSN
jgi:lysophospholipase L1-like esterase